MKLGKETVKNVGGMKLWKRENPEKTPKNLNITHHNEPLAAARHSCNLTDRL